MVASGAHNKAYIPEITRKNSTLQEYHSYNFRNPNILKGKKVTVVGGRASSFDLIDLAFKHGAKEVHWVYRSVTWFTPTTRSNYQREADLRFAGMAQVLGVSRESLARFVGWINKRRYRRYGLEAIMPKEAFNYDKHMGLPGRPGLVKNFSKIIRHPSPIKGIEENFVLTEQDKFETDIVLFGTGYHIDLSYLGLDKLNEIKKPRELQKRCGHLVISLDYPQLYFFGIPFLDSNGSTPLFSAVAAKTLIAHLKNKIELPLKPITRKPLYLEMIKMMALYDQENYSKFLWKIKLFFKMGWYFINRKVTFNLN